MTSSTYMVVVDPGDSIQTAYDSLPASGGIVTMTPGRYDIVNGVSLDRTKPAAFIGLERWRRQVFTAIVPLNDNHMTGAILYSSTATTNPFFRMTTPNSFFNAEGFAWKYLTAELGLSSAMVEGDNLSYSLMEDCVGYTVSGGFMLKLGTYDAFSLGTQHGDQASFNRMICTGVIGDGPGQYSSIGAGSSTTYRYAVGKPFSNHHGNIVGHGGGQVEMYGETNSMVIGNNVEGAVIIADMCSQCTFIGDGGEYRPTATNFLTLKRSSGNFCDELGHSTPGGGAPSGVLYRFESNSKHNLAMAAPLSDSLSFITGAYGQDAAKITDTDAAKPNYYVRPGAYHLGASE